MFKIKNQSNFYKFFAIVLLVFFVASRGLSMLHAFSHQEKGMGFKSDNFLTKLLFAHEKSAEKQSEHCAICSVLNVQNQIVATSPVLFLACFLFFVFALRRFDRVKISYLLSSIAPRAPPLIS